MTPIQKKYVDDNRITSEIVESCICKKCGCRHVQIKRFGRKNSKKKLFEVEELKGEKADLFIINNQKYLVQLEQKCPTPLIASETSLPYVYGYAIAPDKQRTKYAAALPPKDSWRNKFVNGKWLPDIFKSECRVIND